MTRLLLIDNYDSFTYNLYQYLAELGADVTVIRNDAITVEEAVAFDPDLLVISPGPGAPKDAGISIDLIKEMAGKKPILGVCLGHQAMTEAFGGHVVRAHELMHGKASKILHNGEGIFEDLPEDLSAIRYHSLCSDVSTLPAELEVTAKTDSGVIMGLRHRDYEIHGVQFHPESILTEGGKQMLQNFLNIKSPLRAQGAGK